MPQAAHPLRQLVEKRLSDSDATARAFNASSAKREEALRAEGKKQAAAMAKERDAVASEAKGTERSKRSAVEKEL